MPASAGRDEELEELKERQLQMTVKLEELEELVKDLETERQLRKAAVLRAKRQVGGLKHALCNFL